MRDNPPLIQPNEVIRILHRLQPMRNRNHRALPHLFPQDLLYRHCRLHIDGCRCLFSYNYAVSEVHFQSDGGDG